MTLKTDLVWACVVGPTISAEVAAKTGLGMAEVSALLNGLYKSGRIERAPCRMLKLNANGAKCLGGWVYYDNEQRPTARPDIAENRRTQRRRQERERDMAVESAANAFNIWIATI